MDHNVNNGRAAFRSAINTWFLAPPPRNATTVTPRTHTIQTDAPIDLSAAVSRTITSEIRGTLHEQPPRLRPRPGAADELRLTFRASVQGWFGQTMYIQQQRQPRAVSLPVRLDTSESAHRQNSPTAPTQADPSTSPTTAYRLDTIRCHAEQWPPEVTYIPHVVNTHGLQLNEIATTSACRCAIKCYNKTCRNAKRGHFCTALNCSLSTDCGNRQPGLPQHSLRRGRLGLGVHASTDIGAGDIIGEYAGVLTTRRIHVPNGYTMQIRRRTDANNRLYIDASTHGNLMRFINHSCQPNAYFFEMSTHDAVTVLVYALHDISTGTEITAHYGNNLWFRCKCGTPSCVHRRR